MRKSSAILIGACLSILLLAALSCSLAPFTGDLDAAGLKAAVSAKAVKAPAVSDPGQAGPYAVGHTYFMLQDPSRPCDLGPRPIPVEVFYPVDAASVTAATPEAIYPLDPINNFWPLTYSSDWEPYGNDRAYEEPAPSAKKPFPLVVFSPGWGCSIWIHNFLACRLATQGFVVAVMYHYGDWAFPFEQFDHIAVAMLNRPKDMSFVLDNLLVRNAAAGELLSGIFNPDRVAAAGWSLGGYASIELAAGISCVGEIWTYPGWQEFAGGPPPAETLVPLPPDPRFKAIIPFDGSSWAFRFSELARVTVPAMGLGQEWSTLALDPDPQWASQQARQHAAFQGHPSYRVDIWGTNHQSFSNLYEGLTLAYEKGYMPQADYDWVTENYFWAELPSAEANHLTSKYSVAFLKTVLAGESGYQDILTPGHALTREQYIEFFVTEKRSPNAIEEEWPAWPPLSTYFAHQPGCAQAKAAKKP